MPYSTRECPHNHFFFLSAAAAAPKRKVAELALAKGFENVGEKSSLAPPAEAKRARLPAGAMNANNQEIREGYTRTFAADREAAGNAAMARWLQQGKAKPPAGPKPDDDTVDLSGEDDDQAEASEQERQKLYTESQIIGDAI